MTHHPTTQLIDLEETAEGLEPRLPGTETPLSHIVHTCHERTISEGLNELSLPGLDRETLDPLLTYCAERRCETDDATCPGCQRRTDARGIKNIEDFIASHKEILVEDGRVRLTGQGTATLSTPNLAHLAKTWAGEDYWFWARRVLRKLRHGIRRAHISGSPVAPPGDTPSIILTEPQLPENMGMVARAMANFGLDDLRLIAPKDGWPNEKARISASGANYVIDDAAAYPDMSAALSDLNFVVATTARQRPLKKPVLTPEEAIEEIRTRIAKRQRCGILFGRERNGLETSEVANCDALVMIPVNPQFASLNLAQAVLLLAYIWMRGQPMATLGRVTTYERPVQTGINFSTTDTPASKDALFAFFDHLESELCQLGFFNPIEKRPSVVQNLRSMFTRMALTEQEVRSLRGIVATLVKGKGAGRK